ncbi:MAG: BMP family protein [Spirochaetales bacterium]
MKRIMALGLIVFLFAGVSLFAAGEGENYEIAMVTDAGDIDDESFNQGTWEGIVDYAEENDVTHRYYRPAEVSDSAYIDSIDLAVQGGARIVVTPGYLFETAIYESQQSHPDVNFVLIDGIPLDEDGNEDVADNTVSIFYAEEESGFLAGYAAVHDGFNELGFMGGIAVPAVVRFGVGFIAGAYYAADELGEEITFPDDRYDYLGNFDPSDSHNAQAESWYSDGTEVIFAAAGGAGSSVMAAAEDQDAWMIGVDVDQSEQSDRVLTSAMKDLGETAKDILADFYADEFPGGESITLTAAEDGVALPMESSRFREFGESDYDEIFTQIADGEVDVPADYSELSEFFEENDLPDFEIEESTIQP